MTARLASILVLLALLAVLLGGCGGDKRRAESEGSEATTTQPSAVEAEETTPQQSGGAPQITRVTNPARRAYVDKVDAICGQLDPERAKERELVSTAADPTEAAKTYEGTINLGWRELRQIEAIAEPPGEAKLLKANVFDPIKSQLALKARMREALAATDVPLLRRLRSELDNSAQSLTGFARGYGFQVCGES